MMFRDRYDTITTIKLFATVVAFLVVYGYVSNEDYHDMFDKATPIKYNCDMLIGGWHPDVPKKILDECKKKKVDYNGNKEKSNSNIRT